MFRSISSFGNTVFFWWGSLLWNGILTEYPETQQGGFNWYENLLFNLG